MASYDMRAEFEALQERMEARGSGRSTPGGRATPTYGVAGGRLSPALSYGRASPTQEEY